MANKPGGPHYKFVLGDQDVRKVAIMSAGDHQVLKYMASKDQKSMAEELHDLFLAGLKCRSGQHVERMRRLGINI